MGVIAERRVGKRFDFRQEGCHSPGRSGFGGAPFSPNENAANLGIDCI